MDMPLAYRNTTNRTQAPTENPWARPNHGTMTIAATRVVANIKVVDQMRGARAVTTGGCDSAELVFDMGYLWDTEGGRNVARPVTICRHLGECGQRVTVVNASPRTACCGLASAQHSSKPLYRDLCDPVQGSPSTTGPACVARPTRSVEVQRT